MTFRALLLSENDGAVSSEICDLDEATLPDGAVTVSVEYSSLNYKDGMILQGIGRLVRNYPHVPGVDLAGTVEASEDADFEVGDRVLVTGFRVGEVWWGGYAAKARVKSEWLINVPDGLSTQQAMAIGTAGFTGMQALIRLEEAGLSTSDESSLLVTGASGGVGSSAILWAGAAGHHVTASTGRPENSDDLKALGASAVVDRSEFSKAPTRPLTGERWAGCIDAVGGTTLATVLTQMAYGSSVAACGLAGGNELSTTVIPFLLRSVNLLGIDSVMASTREREKVWGRIATSSGLDKLAQLTTEVALSEVPALGPEILAGKIKGRTVIDTSR